MRRAPTLLLGALALWGCNSNNLTPVSLVQSVRILATSADKPYALPGDTVTMQVLAFDGRASQLTPMGVWWLPQPCIDPPGDAFYACFPAFAESYAPGVDLTSQLVPGPAFSFGMPSDAIAAHSGSRGGEPYGLAVVFTIACAGHVQYLSPAPGAPPDTLPFGCFDAANNLLGPDEFVFAYSLVYAFTDRTNANPVIQSITFEGSTVDPAVGITVEHCTQSNIDKCSTTALDTIVPASSDETDPGDLDANGNPLKEEIYVEYFLTAGKVKNDSMILYDPAAGLLPNTSDDFYAPQSPGSFYLWAVVHDNRGGVAWQQVPLVAN